MRVLIIGWLHPKNKLGLSAMLTYLKFDFHFGNQSDIENYDTIYCPSDVIDTTKYPSKKFIFGPHFSVFPDARILSVKVYIQPSEWVTRVWNDRLTRPVVCSMPFPVDTEHFAPIKPIGDRHDIFVYYKRRDPTELSAVLSYLNERGITYEFFNYEKGYIEEDYHECLQNAKYGIIIDAHESQGFAIEEALSCDVPLLVWNVTEMSQEYNSNYPKIPATSIPYWDNRCGEVFTEFSEFENVYTRLLENIFTYRPRNYIIENLSTANCAVRFSNILY